MFSRFEAASLYFSFKRRAFVHKAMVKKQIHLQRKPRTGKVIEAIVRDQKEKALNHFREEFSDQPCRTKSCQESSESKMSADLISITRQNGNQIVRSISNEHFLDGLLIIAPDQNAAFRELLFSTCDEHNLRQIFKFFPTESLNDQKDFP